MAISIGFMNTVNGVVQCADQLPTELVLRSNPLNCLSTGLFNGLRTRFPESRVEFELPIEPLNSPVNWHSRCESIGSLIIQRPKTMWIPTWMASWFGGWFTTWITMWIVRFTHWNITKQFTRMFMEHYTVLFTMVFNNSLLPSEQPVGIHTGQPIDILIAYHWGIQWVIQ